MKKMTKRKQNRKVNVKQLGGVSDNIPHTLLINSIISYLPSTETVKNESKIRDYLNSIDALTLLEIIGSDEKYMNSSSIKYLIESIDRNTLELIRHMGEAIKVPGVKKSMETFEVDCVRLSKKTTVKELLELPNYLLDCNDEICNRNINWYDVVLGFRKIDNDYEELVRQEITKKNIIINTSNSLMARDKLRKNNTVREIFKRRLLKCCQDPRSFFDKLKGSVAWVDYNQCTKCPTDDCILYIDENYRNFLMMDLDISSVSKIKILIFMEIRIHLLSKFIFIESLRLNGARKRRVGKLVERIYRSDYKNGRMISPSDRVRTSERLIGGADMSPMRDASPISDASPMRDASLISDASPISDSSPIPGASLTGSSGDNSLTESSLNSLPGSYGDIPETDKKDAEQSDSGDDSDEDDELVIYFTYNILKKVKDMGALKELMINGVKRISHISESSAIMIGNLEGTDKGIRKGTCTYSIEVTIGKSDIPEDSFENIRRNISDAINDGSFQNIMNVMNKTVSLRDVYFKDLNRYLSGSNLKFKRGIAEIKLPYPARSAKEKAKFSIKVKQIMYTAVNSLFSEFNLGKERVQLELISAVDDDETLVMVQFMIMDSYSKLKDSYYIAETIEQTMGGDSLGMRSELLGQVTMIDKCYLFDTDTVCNASNKKIIEDGVKNVGIQKDNIVVVNDNCKEVVTALRSNYVSNKHLSENCNDAINEELGKRVRVDE